MLALYHVFLLCSTSYPSIIPLFQQRLCSTLDPSVIAIFVSVRPLSFLVRFHSCCLLYLSPRLTPLTPCPVPLTSSRSCTTRASGECSAIRSSRRAAAAEQSSEERGASLMCVVCCVVSASSATNRIIAAKDHASVQVRRRRAADRQATSQRLSSSCLSPFARCSHAIRGSLAAEASLATMQTGD